MNGEFFDLFNTHMNFSIPEGQFLQFNIEIPETIADDLMEVGTGLAIYLKAQLLGRPFDPWRNLGVPELLKVNRSA